jgi:PadR family transcriptional regulator PadR
MKDAQTDSPPALPRGNTDVLLLSLIDRLDSIYGYQLIREMERRSQGFFRFKEGTIYPILRKMENEGLIRGHWQVLATGQSRRYYHITAKGKQALKEKMTVWQDFTAAVNLIFRLGEA